MPADPVDLETLRGALGRFGEPAAGSATSAAVQVESETLPDIVRALDSEGIKVANLALHEPSLDDVFLAETGRSLEGAADGDEDE